MLINANVQAHECFEHHIHSTCSFTEFFAVIHIWYHTSNLLLSDFSLYKTLLHFVLQHPTQLVIVIDGKPQSLTEHMQEFTRRHYPNVGHASIMVPPLLFHQNWNLTDKAATANVQGQGDVFKSVSRSVSLPVLTVSVCLSVCPTAFVHV